MRIRYTLGQLMVAVGVAGAALGLALNYPVPFILLLLASIIAYFGYIRVVVLLAGTIHRGGGRLVEGHISRSCEGRAVRIRYTLGQLMVAVGVAGVVLGLAVNYPMLFILLLLAAIIGVGFL
jgi:hypothetical protein